MFLKVFEGLIYNIVIGMVSKFIRNTSTFQQLQVLLYFHQLVTSRDEVDVVYIYLCKAFYSVPHNELLLLKH